MGGASVFCNPDASTISAVQLNLLGQPMTFRPLASLARRCDHGSQVLLLPWSYRGMHYLVMSIRLALVKS